MISYSLQSQDTMITILKIIDFSKLKQRLNLDIFYLSLNFLIISVHTSHKHYDNIKLLSTKLPAFLIALLDLDLNKTLMLCIGAYF